MHINITDHKNKESFGLIISIAIIIVCLVVYAGKAFHIDDTLFIFSAKQINKTPFDFYGFLLNWYGTEEPMHEIMQNPPLTCYYIAVIGKLFGFGEIQLHMAFLLPVILLAYGIYILARQLCQSPNIAVLSAALTPAFIVSATNIMCDVMMVCFWIWAIIFWRMGLKSNKIGCYFIASILIAFSFLSKYFGLALIPLLLTYSILEKRRIHASMLFLLIPILFLIGYLWLFSSLYGHNPLKHAAEYSLSMKPIPGSKVLSKTLVGLIFTGGCGITALLFSPLLCKWRTLLIIVFIAVGSSLIITLGDDELGVFSTGRSQYVNWFILGQLFLMATGGMVVFFLVVADVKTFKDADSVLLLLWVLGTFVFTAYLNWTINARTILPLIPALAILISRRLDFMQGKSGRTVKNKQVICLFAIAAIVSMLVGFSDYKMANSARTAAKEIDAKYASSKEQLYFQGHWGFQYYMDSYGYRPMNIEKPVYKQNDIFVIPLNNSFIRPIRGKNISLIDVFEYEACPFLATMQASLGAGFYSDGWGPLPFVFAPNRIEAYMVFQVK